MVGGALEVTDDQYQQTAPADRSQDKIPQSRDEITAITATSGLVAAAAEVSPKHLHDSVHV